MQAALALLVVLLSQAAFWALLHAGAFLGALGANVVFWCAAFPAWVAAGRRWWKPSASPDVALALVLIALAATSFFLAMDDAAAEATRNAWFWVGMFEVPVALVAATLATLRAQALRSARGWGPRPMTALIMAAVVLALALAVFAGLVLVNVGGPR